MQLEFQDGQAALAIAGDLASDQLEGLPEWNLADLYPAIDSPEVAADMAEAEKSAIEFEDRWKGKLAEEASKGEEGRLGEAIASYEALEELISRIASYAGLVYASDTSDPGHAKFYGDVQEKMTDASITTARARKDT